MKELKRKRKILEKVENLLNVVGYNKLSWQIRSEIMKINKEIYDIENKAV